MAFKTNNTDQSRDYVTPATAAAGVNSLVDKIAAGAAVLEQRPDQAEAHTIRPRPANPAYNPSLKSASATDATRDYVTPASGGTTTNSFAAKQASGQSIVEWRPDQEQQTATRPRTWNGLP